MSGAVRKLLTPRWVALHLTAWAAAIAMVFLGRWQLDVSNEKHFDLQNFGYAFQWWIFSAATILFWLRAMRDSVRGRPTDVSTGGELVLRRGESGLDFVGPANLVAPAGPAAGAGQEPLVYRGYRMPQSSQGPVRAQGDAFQSSYNDYLWHLALADGATPPVHPPSRSAATEPNRPAERAGELLGDD